MTYNLSTTMAEKLIYETTLSSSNSNTNTSNSITTTPSTNATSNNNSLNLNRIQENNNNNTDSNVSILSKKIAGGIRLPFLPAVNSNNLNSTGIQSTKNETETTSNSNSKSKRPISSQLQDFNLVSPTTTSATTTSEFKLNKQHNKSASSSSNENLVDVGSEDDLEIKKINNKIISNSSSREKTPEQQQKSNLIESKSPTTNDYNNEENQINSSFQPVPAPRKQKSGPLSKDGIKSFFRINSGVGNPTAPSPTTTTTATSSTSSQSIMSPKLGRKPILTSVTETSNNTIKIEDLDNNNETSQLNHLNKSRPKRQNVKRPTAKNPLSNIESEILLEESLSTNVNDSTLPNSKSNQNNNINKESENENEQQQSLSNDLSENKKISPVISANKSNLFPEQPKIK
jgi:trimeric autotransporter adhesin